MNLKTLEDLPPWEWPEGADKMLLGILRDDQADASDRLLATELAGDFVVINDQLADVLLLILCKGDEAEELRGRAAISLGPVLEYADTYEFEDPDEVPITESTFRRIQETLRKLYQETNVPKEVRCRILEASVRAPQDWHQDAVRTAYSSDDEDWNLTAVFCMCFVRGFNDQILEALESANPDIHYQAVWAAGNWELDEAWPHIAALVTSAETEKHLLLAGIDAVASIRPQEAAGVLSDLINSDDEDIAAAAYEAIGMIAEEPWDDEDDEFP